MAEKICLGCMNKYDGMSNTCPYCGYVDGTPAARPFHLPPGAILQDKYIVGRVLGYGGMGATYIGYDELLQQKVAIKEYLPSDFATRCPGMSAVSVYSGEQEQQFNAGVRKFMEEANHLAQFKGVPGIVDIYDTFCENSTAYIVMEYLEGETLEKRLERQERLSAQDAFNIILPVLTALKSVHKEHMLHRDISPHNIFLTTSGEVKLLDFGAARYASTTHSKSLSVLVKPGYTPQEQYRSRGDQGTWTDVYACAATLYRMLTGVTPEDAMERGVKDNLVPPTKLGANITKNQENAIMNALNLRIEDRTQTADAFERDLITSDDVNRTKIKQKKSDIGRWPMWLKIAMGSVAALIVTAVVLLLTGVISFQEIRPYSGSGLAAGQVYVPDVMNISLEEAEQKLQTVKLNYQIVDQQNSDMVPRGYVMNQGIAAGTVVNEGTSLDLIVSAGGDAVSAPRLVGYNKDAAIAQLNNDRLYYNVTEEESVISPGFVASQSIEAGTGIAQGDTLNISVSAGMSNYDVTQTSKVPKLKKATWEKAVEKIQKKNLYICIVGATYSESIPEGCIISQEIKSGEKVAQGTTVGVTISLGLLKTEVPDVLYKSEKSAKKKIKNAGLKVKVKHEKNKAVKKGYVTRQSVDAGTEVDMQTEITIWVSSGAPK